AEAIIVVDTASSEVERSRLRAACGARPPVRLLLLDRNVQFAGGLNAGARAAMEAGADRLLLLNNDTVLAPDALRLLLDALAAAPGAGIAGPRVVDLQDPARELSAGERPSLALPCVPPVLIRYPRSPPPPPPLRGGHGCAPPA